MQQYYQESMITISAMSAESSLTGILHPRIPRYRPLSLSLNSIKIGWEGEVRFRPCHEQYLSDFLFKSPGPLHTRGWTYQEYYLPPRSIHFSKRGMVWDCVSHTIMEWNYRPLRDLLTGKLYKGQAVVLSTESVLVQRGNTPLKMMYAKWEEIVTQYSARNLSYSSDRLPAISGLASLLHKRLSSEEDEYLAGLWKGALVQQLSWRVVGPLKDRYCQYQAPSWSWVAVDQSVYFLVRSHFHYQHAATIVEAYVQPRDPELQPFGAVKDGYVRIRAPWILGYVPCLPYQGMRLILLELDRDTGDGLENPLWSGHLKVSSRYADGYTIHNPPQRGAGAIGLNSDTVTADHNANHTPDSGLAIIRDTICTPIVGLDVLPNAAELLDDHGRFCFGLLMICDQYFLILQPNQDRLGTFCRIGVASLGYSHKDRRKFSEEYLQRMMSDIVIT